MNTDSTTSTICAISTPAGIGGIAVARVSGDDAFSVVQKIWKGKKLDTCASHTAHLGTVLDSVGQPLDSAVITIFRAPASFTRQNVVEISVHGSIYVQQELLASLCAAGARLAEPGEFTRRAFAAGNLDLAQAEAVADIIASTNKAAHRLAINQMRGGISLKLVQLRSKLIDLASLLELELDFSEEDVEFASRRQLMDIATEVDTEIARLLNSFVAGNAIRQGIPVAIAGATNVGKSSLLNALVGDNRAIVSNIHGTTRDLVEDTIVIGDYQFRFIDTAGLRHTTDTVESIGIDRARDAIKRASIVIAVLDAQTTEIPADILRCTQQVAADGAHTIVCINKTDVAPADAIKTLVQKHLPDAPIIEISALTGIGIDRLSAHLHDTVASDKDFSAADVTITNARHRQALTLAQESIQRVIQGIRDNISGDFIAQDLRDTLSHLAEITGGQITTPTILNTIFSRFCIGK